MTKTLTEQWREGTLRGCFYWKLPNGNICTAYADTMRDIKNVRDSDEVEVLQEAPSYVEYKRLQEQLNEANKTLKYFADSTIGAEQEDGRYICGMAGFDGTKGQIIYYDPRPAKQYLKKWGVK